MAAVEAAGCTAVVSASAANRITAESSFELVVRVWCMQTPTGRGQNPEPVGVGQTSHPLSVRLATLPCTPLDWRHPMELAGVIIAAIAALSAIAAAYVAWRQMKDAQQSAVDAQAEAARATEAAEKAAGAAVRSADAADKSAEAQSTLARLASTDAAKPPWSISHHSGDRYAVINGGPTPVFGVEVRGETVHRGPVTQERVDGGAPLTFMGAAWMGSDNTIMVHWHTREDLSDPQQVWTSVLPPRPPKTPRKRR